MRLFATTQNRPPKTTVRARLGRSDARDCQPPGSKGPGSTVEASRCTHDFGRMAVHPNGHDLGRVTLLADVDAGVPPAAPPAKTPPSKRPTAPPPKAAPEPECKFTVTYANEKSLQCPDPKEPRGAISRFDITKVRAVGKDCPATLDGLKLTEEVTSDSGCHPQKPEIGPGCTVHADKATPREGRFVDCQDTYKLCGDNQAFKFLGCTQILTQKIFIGGMLADTRKIKFEIFRRGEQPSGKATRL